MGTRLELQTFLQSIMDSYTGFVYFQPPPSIEMSYPCIVYDRSNIRTDYADNNPYNLKKEYTITVIDRDPDSSIPDQIAMIPTSSFSRSYKADNLNHDVFTIFY